MIDESRIEGIAARLIGVRGVRAVVLGGSRARGTHHPGSDVDLGLYYDHELDLDELQRVASDLNEDGEVTLAAPGEWGPWVNGGCWLTIADTPVDLILRDLTRVEEMCERAVRGEFAFHPQPGHPLGFLDVSYAGEVPTARVLADPDGVVAHLKQPLTPYPDRLRRALVDNLWQAEFLVDAAAKGVPKADVTYIVLCCSTALMLCAHAWHAVAGVWVTNEKGVVPDTAGLPVDTHGFAERAAAALASVTDPTADLTGALDVLATLVRETRDQLGRA